MKWFIKNQEVIKFTYLKKETGRLKTRHILELIFDLNFNLLKCFYQEKLIENLEENTLKNWFGQNWLEDAIKYIKNQEKKEEIQKKKIEKMETFSIFQVYYNTFNPKILT